MMTTTTLAAATDSRFSCNICLEPVVEPVVTLCGHLYCWPCLYRWLEPGMNSSEFSDLWGGVMRMRAVDQSRRTCPVCKTSCSVSSIVPIYVRGHNDVRVDSPITLGEQDDQRQQSETASVTHQQQQEIHDETNSNTIDDENNEDDEEEDDDEDEDDKVSTTADDATTSTDNTGLRRRRNRRRDNEQQQQQQQQEPHVPTRPQYSPPPSSNSDNINNRNSNSTPPHNDRTTHLAPGISHGLTLSLQQALFGSNTAVPPLHNQNFYQQDQDPTATEFLSRLLLMLGSFVILCLLLF